MWRNLMGSILRRGTVVRSQRLDRPLPSIHDLETVVTKSYVEVEYAYGSDD